MLPPVEADEQLMARGLYHQVRQGVPTGVHELWSAHALPDEATIWRSQLAYEGVSPFSACYLLRDPDFRPIQLVFYWRWQDGREDLIEYRFMPRHMSILHGDTIQDMILPASYEVYGWHTVTEHALWASYNRASRGWQSITLVTPGIQGGTLWPALMQVRAEYQRSEIMPGPGGPHSARQFAVEMEEMGAQSLYFDGYGVPLRWVLPEENLVVELLEYERAD
ncbi:MAG: hypothetical protein JXN59_07075 [Anaerolineae bacterium]|nr:hypothetical protein [Anaerolineae bacterium]